MTVHKNNAGYEYNFMYLGKRYHRSFKGLSKKEVIAKEEAAKTDLRRKIYSSEKEKKIKLSEIIADHELYQKIHYSRPNEFNYVIKKFLKLVGDKDIQTIRLQEFEKYRALRIGKVKKSTINRELDVIRRIFSLAVENGKLEINPCTQLKKLRIDSLYIT